MTDPSRPLPRASIAAIDTYVPGKAGSPNSHAVKLSANESPLGASPKAMAAFRDAAGSLAVYPEGSSRLLRSALSEVHGIDAEKIVCGNGSGDLLALLAQAYLEEGDEAVMSRYAFSLYPIFTKAAGARLVIAEPSDYKTDVDALLAAVTPRTKIVWLDNPNNPTGTYLPAAELRRLHSGLPATTLLVIDSAYAEYATAEDYSAGLELVQGHENVVMVRTLSKMGLAAARIGWMVGPAHVVETIHRIRGPFNVSLAGQLAGAAAVRDVDFTSRLCAHNARWRDWLTAEVTGNAVRIVPSQANFVMALFPDARQAASAFDALLAAGWIVREIGASYGIPEGLRISIGSEEAMRGVADVLKQLVSSS